MFYTGIDPRDMSEVYVPKAQKEKAMQRALLQYRKKENYKLVAEALNKAGRLDLIGFERKSLIKPQKPGTVNKIKNNKNNKNYNKSYQ
jgi:hypothetical protein